MAWRAASRANGRLVAEGGKVTVHQADLLHSGDLARAGQPLQPIEPLD
jgi:hypothetical protein